MMRVPAAPNGPATALWAMYRPISHLPIQKRSEVTAAPTHTSLHSMRTLGRIL